MRTLTHVGRIVPLLAFAAALFAQPGRLQAQGAEEPRVISQGPGWRLLDPDPQAAGGYVWEMMRGAIQEVPVSESQRQFVNDALAMDPDDVDAMVYADKDALDAMESEQAAGASASSLFGFSCGWNRREKTIDRDFDETLLDRDFPFSTPIEGHLRINLPISGHVTATFRYKQFECGFRTPLLKPVDAWANGNVRALGEGSLEVNATARATFEREWKLSEPVLGSFSVSGFQFVFTLPTYAGVLLDARLTGTLAAQLDASASGTFNYYCKWGGPCSGSSDFTDQFELNGPVASAQLDLKAQANARVMLRVSLYSPSVAYAEGGLKPWAEANIWGYYGNACGDADGDGTNETVEALAADLKAGFKFAYGWDTFFTNRHLHFTGGREWLLGWRDLLGSGGSTALQPMLLGPSSVVQGTPAEYTVRMRPCYPYGDRVDFTLAPGTWTGGTSVEPGSTGTLVQTTFADVSSPRLTVTATTDSAGRGIGVPYSRTITVTSAAPAAPSALRGTVLSPTSVRLNWTDNSDNETQFELQRRLPGGAWNNVLTPPANATQATDTSVSASTTYEYRIRARAGIYASGFSNVVTVTTSSNTPPAPSNLTAMVLSASSVRLSWTDNSGNETSFEVERQVPGGAFARLASVGANLVAFTDGTAASMTTYSYRVRAVNGAGGSAFTAPATVTLPQHPSYQGCFTDSSTRALPAWLATAGSTVESCRAAAYAAGHRYAGLQYYGHCFGGNTLAYSQVANAECNTPCNANTAQMCGGAWRNSIYDTGYVPPAPTAPSALTAGFDTASRTIRLSWTDNSTNETGFTTQFSYSGSAFSEFCSVGANVTTCASGPNPPAGSYQFRVRAFSGGLSSAWSNTASLFVPAPPPPSTSIAWIQPAESSWGTPGTLTAAGYAQNGTGNVQLVWRERGDDGFWGPWTTVPYQAPVSPDGTWSNTISSGNPTNKCHWFEAYTNYSGVSSSVFRYTGAPGCPTPSASVAWIQPAESSWGPAGTMTAAGYASGGVGGVQLVWRERSSSGLWGPWNTVAYPPPPSPDTTWSNTIPSANKCNWFDAYVNYSSITSAVYRYTGTSGCP